MQQISTNGAALNTTFNNGGDGYDPVDLRNLGANRTLVLVNGRRWVTDLAGCGRPQHRSRSRSSSASKS